MRVRAGRWAARGAGVPMPEMMRNGRASLKPLSRPTPRAANPNETPMKRRKSDVAAARHGKGFRVRRRGGGRYGASSSELDDAPSGPPSSRTWARPSAPRISTPPGAATSVQPSSSPPPDTPSPTRRRDAILDAVRSKPCLFGRKFTNQPTSTTRTSVGSALHCSAAASGASEPRYPVDCELRLCSVRLVLQKNPLRVHALARAPRRPAPHPPRRRCRFVVRRPAGGRGARPHAREACEGGRRRRRPADRRRRVGGRHRREYARPRGAGAELGRGPGVTRSCIKAGGKSN